MNTPSRSPLGAFYRSPLGVRGAGGIYIYIAGYNFIDDNTGLTCNTAVHSVSGTRAKNIKNLSFGSLVILKIFADSSGNIITLAMPSYSSYPSMVTKYSKNGGVLFSYDVELDGEYSEEFPMWIQDVFVGADDNIYILCRKEIDLDGFIEAETLLKKVTTNGALLSVPLESPAGMRLGSDWWSGGSEGVRVDANGDILIFSDVIFSKLIDNSRHNNIAKWDKNGVLLWRTDNPTGSYPGIANLTFGAAGDFYYTTYQNLNSPNYGELRAYKNNGDGTQAWSTQYVLDPMNIAYTFDILFGKDGDVYVLSSHSIFRFSALGEIRGRMFSHGGRYSLRLQMDSSGRLYSLYYKWVNDHEPEGRYESVVEIYEPNRPPWMFNGEGTWYPVSEFNSQADAEDMVIVE